MNLKNLLFAGLICALSGIFTAASANSVRGGDKNDALPSENRTVTGTVVDATTGEPIIGATIIEKGSTTNGTTSDYTGAFSITLPRGAQLDVSYVGYKTRTVDVGTLGVVDVKLDPDDALEAVVVVGAGTQKMYDYLNDNPECMSAPVDYTNDIRSISALDNFISINNAVDIDLFGQVNAESAGVKHISGAGGQLDFVLGAYLSKGGKSFICLSSTFFNKKTGQLESRIRPTLENGSIITDTRANLHYLCTEYGCVNLKGLTTWEKAEALINVAHPDFREELIKEAEKMHIWRRSNKI